MLPIGAYDARWPDVHLNPDEAIRVHRELGGGVMLPIHWATFDLAFHEWSDPVEWVLQDADEGTLALPAPGGRFDLEDDLPVEPWWRPSA
jgi:L-ascorbate metabolism protein UlaG (beta-lactamase superfamily)